MESTYKGSILFEITSIWEDYKYDIRAIRVHISVQMDTDLGVLPDPIPNGTRGNMILCGIYVSSTGLLYTLFVGIYKTQYSKQSRY